MAPARDDALPTLRWGILGAGMISSWFVQDLALPRPNRRANHIISALGSSSIKKGTEFVASHIPDASPAVYDKYEDVYADPNVDIIYIGTPHASHRQNALDAIRAHKHVLCEKPFTVNAREAAEVLEAARREGVFVMEAMWTRFRPLVAELRRQIFDERVIGDVQRAFCDFGLEMDLAALPASSRLKSRDLGAGSLLDIGIYSLTWGLLTLDESIADSAAKMEVTGIQTIREGIDTTSTVVLKYPNSGRHGILTSTLDFQSSSTFCRIEGSKGHIEVSGAAASAPSSFTVHRKGISNSKNDGTSAGEPSSQAFSFDEQGFGFYHEADAVAVDIAAGRKENELMPHAETLRVLSILDEVRKQGGASFPQDEV